MRTLKTLVAALALSLSAGCVDPSVEVKNSNGNAVVETTAPYMEPKTFHRAYAKNQLVTFITKPSKEGGKILAGESSVYTAISTDVLHIIIKDGNLSIPEGTPYSQVKFFDYETDNNGDRIGDGKPNALTISRCSGEKDKSPKNVYLTGTYRRNNWSKFNRTHRSNLDSDTPFDSFVDNEGKQTHDWDYIQGTQANMVTLVSPVLSNNQYAQLFNQARKDPYSLDRDSLSLICAGQAPAAYEKVRAFIRDLGYQTSDTNYIVRGVAEDATESLANQLVLGSLAPK